MAHMSTVCLIAAGVFLLISAALALYRKNTLQVVDELWAVDTYDARELRRMCSGGFDATVEVQGEVSCDQPIISLAAQTPCCWFRTVVEREERKTRTVTETDARGNRTTRTETYYEWETTFDRTQCVVFKVHDPTGFTLVDPERAAIDSERVVRKTVRHREPWFGPEVRHSDTGKYRITEHVFAPSGFAFVLGRASCLGDEVIIRYPDTGYLDPKKRHFIISRKTEQELTRSRQVSASVCFWFSIAALLAAGACLVFAVAGPR